jgi:glycosyltransferase involved in cell wall biosynthesis
MKPPLISVITAVKNGAACLESAMSSVEGQYFRDFEYIVIDGGSEDGTVEIIERHKEAMAYWVSEPDKGIADAFNKGVLASRGSVLLFMGSDDCLKDNAVLGQVEEAMKDLKKPYFFYGDIDYVYAKQVRRIEKNYSCQKFRSYSCIPHQAMFLDRFFFEKYGLFDCGYKIAMDYEHTARFIREHRPEHVAIVVAEMRRYGVSSNPLAAHREMDRVRLKHGLASRFEVRLSQAVLRMKLAVAKVFHRDW